MKNEIRIVGSGGQGVILCGIILAHAFGIYEKLEVVQTQSYGPESRGGACQTELIVADSAIDYMKVVEPNYLIAFNELGYKKYVENKVTDKTTVLVDSTFIQSSDDKFFQIPATQIAESELKGFVANIVMLGAFAKVCDFIDYASLEKAVQDVVNPAFYEINLKALKFGYERLGEAAE